MKRRGDLETKAAPRREVVELIESNDKDQSYAHFNETYRGSHQYTGDLHTHHLSLLKQAVAAKIPEPWIHSAASLRELLARPEGLRKAHIASHGTTPGVDRKSGLHAYLHQTLPGILKYTSGSDITRIVVTPGLTEEGEPQVRYEIAETKTAISTFVISG